MMLTDCNGNRQEVKVGLVDSDGMFLLLDSNETNYYHFSNEQQAIDALQSQLTEAAKRLETTEAQLKKSEKGRKEWSTRYRKLLTRHANLVEKVKEVGPHGEEDD